MTILCPVCRSTAGDGKHIGDDTLFLCPRCGNYRMSGTLLEEIKNGVFKLPTAEVFRELVKKKRGNSTEYPVITRYDVVA